MIVLGELVRKKIIPHFRTAELYFPIFGRVSFTLA
jgi:hypothetical protein